MSWTQLIGMIPTCWPVVIIMCWKYTCICTVISQWGYFVHKYVGMKLLTKYQNTHIWVDYSIINHSSFVWHKTTDLGKCDLDKGQIYKSSRGQTMNIRTSTGCGAVTNSFWVPAPVPCAGLFSNVSATNDSAENTQNKYT